MDLVKCKNCSFYGLVEQPVKKCPFCGKEELRWTTESERSLEMIKKVLKSVLKKVLGKKKKKEKKKDLFDVSLRDVGKAIKRTAKKGVIKIIERV